MDDKQILPEDALARFNNDDFNIFDIQGATHKYQQLRYGFRVGMIGLLLAEQTMAEVLDEYAIYPMPNTCDWMKGIVSVRGNLVPVFDLEELLGIDEKANARPMLLILGKGESSIGVLVNYLPESHDISEWQQMKNIPDLSNNLTTYASMAYVNNEIFWLEINHEAYFQSIKSQIAI